MRKVGEILQKKRLEKNFTLEDIEKKTKIRKKFLQAIETGDYSQFSSTTYLRGFIKNYSDFLNLPTDEILAVFRREFDENEKIGVLPKSLSEPLVPPFARLTAGKATFTIVAVLLILFFAYLIKGYISVSGVPLLTISQPEAGAKVSQEKVLVIGKTDPKARLTINDQEVFPDQNGGFSQEVTVNEKTTSIKVIAENKEGKKAVIERVIEVDL
ncbi:MAG: helix-turn-helix domain-containing protein [Patescibacteria group bacterium]|nr:helix-turn-helix domain-containing protein [Patescibacteria group bacterium]